MQHAFQAFFGGGGLALGDIGSSNIGRKLNGKLFALHVDMVQCLLCHAPRRVLHTYIDRIALYDIGWKYYVVYCMWILFEIATVYLIFPETYERTMEALSFLFEGG